MKGDMNTKKLIAREGLIIIGIAIIVIIWSFDIIFYQPISTDKDNFYMPMTKYLRNRFAMAYIVYLFYLIISFIVWAIKTLLDKPTK